MYVLTQVCVFSFLGLVHLPLVGAEVEGDLIASLGSEVVRDSAIGFSL